MGRITMDEYQSQKIVRYLRNASPFFWNIIPGVKEDVRIRLAELELDYNVKSKATYYSLLENLIEMNGPEKIVWAIKKQIEGVFTDENLETLRRYWHDGRVPDTGYLRRHKLLDRGSIFLEINTQYDYVGGWATFAGIWFEEIKPYLQENAQIGEAKNG